MSPVLLISVLLYKVLSNPHVAIAIHKGAKQLTCVCGSNLVCVSSIENTAWERELSAFI